MMTVIGLRWFDGLLVSPLVNGTTKYVASHIKRHFMALQGEIVLILKLGIKRGFETKRAST